MFIEVYKQNKWKQDFRLQISQHIQTGGAEVKGCLLSCYLYLGKLLYKL